MTMPADFDAWLTTPPDDDDETPPLCTPGDHQGACASCTHPDL